METSKNSPILVTGATGYLASHIIKILLEKGHRVRGTVRSLAKKERYEYLYDLVPGARDHLEFVEAELLDAECWKKAVEGIEYILHVASPCTASEPNDENELIKPAVEGVLNVLQAAADKGVKKIVLTSSVAAIHMGHPGKNCGPEDWSLEEACTAYPKSKLRAERAAWDFWKKNEGKFELVVVNPSYLLGPILSKAGSGSASEQAIGDLFLENVPALPQMHIPSVDVRDVAECHVRALFTSNTSGKRYICSAESLWFAQISGYLKDEFAKYGYKFPKFTVGKCIVGFTSLWDKRARRIKKEIGLEFYMNNELSVKELGMTYRPLPQALVDMGYSMIKNGLVPNKLPKDKN